MDRRTSAGDRRAAPRGGRRTTDHDGRPVVLIVDDHVDSRELLATVLQELGVVIAEAGNGREAAQRLAAFPVPSLVLVDLALPDCHGTDIVRKMKREPATADVPVVVLSASVMASDKEAAAQAGCAAFVEKPILPDDVVALVRRLLAGAAG